MRRLALWLFAAVLLALIYWLSANSVDNSSVALPEHDDWREDTGRIVMFVGLACFIALRVVGAAKRNRPVLDPDPRAEVVFSASAAQVALISVLLVACAVGSYLLPSSEQPSQSSLLFAIAGAGMALVAVFLIVLHFVCGGFRLSLSERGLDYAPFKCGPIAWQDILNVDVRKYLSSEVVSLQLADREKYFARGFPKSGRIMGRFVNALSPSSPFVISAKQAHSSTDTILRAINARLVAFGSTPDVKETP